MFQNYRMSTTDVGEVSCLTSQLNELKLEMSRKDQEIALQRKRAEFFRERAENLEKEKTLLIERIEEETKKRIGIRYTK